MTTKRFPYRRPDGGISVIVPAPKSQLLGESESVWLDRIIKHTIDNATDVAEQLPMCEADTLPSRRFRDAWRNDGGTVRTHIPIARNMRMDEIREERNALLIASDGKAEVEARKARSNNPDNKVQEWDTYKQALADIPATIDLSNLTDEQSLSDFEPNWPMPPDEI